MPHGPRCHLCEWDGMLKEQLVIQKNQFKCNCDIYLTLEAIRFQVDLENVTTQTLNQVVEGKYMYTLAILDVKTLVNVDKVTRFHLQVVVCHFVHLDSTFFYVIGAQKNQNRVMLL